MQPSSVDGAASSQGGTSVSNTTTAPGGSGGAGQPLPYIPAWARWVLGSIVCLALPFYKKILRAEDEVQKDVEAVVEVVEKLAEVAERVATDVADALPADGSLKQAALEAQHLAEELAKDAEQAEDLLHKVDEIKEEINEDVEAMLDPMAEKAEVEQDSEAKCQASPSTVSSKSLENEETL